MVFSVTEQLQELLIKVPEKLKVFSGEEITNPRSPGKWSRLQILGHLCDSAVNNLTRFIQATYHPEPVPLIPYNQDAWVAAQRYAETPIDEVGILWLSLNQSILRVISNLPKQTYTKKFTLTDGETVTLEWLVEDYLVHMKHHLRQLFPDFE